MTYTPPKLLTFEEFLRQYGDDPCYELIDGELRDMEPTGPHESVSGKLAGRLFVEILRTSLKWTIPKNCLIRPPATEATALRQGGSAARCCRGKLPPQTLRLMWLS